MLFWIDGEAVSFVESSNGLVLIGAPLSSNGLEDTDVSEGLGSSKGLDMDVSEGCVSSNGFEDTHLSEGRGSSKGFRDAGSGSPKGFLSLSYSSSSSNGCMKGGVLDFSRGLHFSKIGGEAGR